jgi:AcrR family transcriptional regulator
MSRVSIAAIFHKFMARGRKKGDHDARRQEIAEAACAVFLRTGLARTSLADIAREMGYTTGVLRHYFADKDELLLRAKNVMFDRVWERAYAVAEQFDGLQKLKAIAAEKIASDAESIDGYRLLAMFNGNSIGDARLMKLQHKRNEAHVAALADIVAGLQREGALRQDLDPKLEAMGILALLDGLGEAQIVHQHPYSRESQQIIVNRYIDALTPPPRIPPRRRA